MEDSETIYYYLLVSCLACMTEQIRPHSLHRLVFHMV